MNSNDPDPVLPDQTGGDSPAEPQPAAKPRRRRAASPKSADTVVADQASAETPLTRAAPEDLPAETAPAKPKRTRRKPSVADDATPLSAEQSPSSEPASVAPAAPAAAVPADASPAVGAPQDSPPTQDAEGGTEEPRRRNRNRRRGRRGGADRAERADMAPTADGEGPAPYDEGDEDAGEEREETMAPATAPLPPVDAGETFADVVSGAYDAEPAEEPEAAATERRVLAPEPDAPKLHKVLAQAGIGSRRDMEDLIAEGRVTVNGQPAHIGQRISFGDQIKVAGKPVKVRIAPPPPRVLAYHKPVGEVVTNDDPQHRPTVFRRLPKLHQGKWQSVGRLDINTEGLLLFTNSGELANQLMHPRFGVEREYAVRVLGTLDEDARESLLEGVEIDGQRAAFKSITDGGGEGVNHWYRVVITEGRNREVRKLFDSVGLGVSRLIRIRYGCVVLPRGLKRGVWVDLNEQEVRMLRQLAGGRDRQAEHGARDGERGAGKSRRNRRGGRGGGEDRGHERREPGEGGPIPNPLQQTFDKRAIREARQPRREYSDEGPIPNPLEQTYDKRFVQKQRGFGGGGGGGRGKGGGQGGGQPDPMKTSLGYIGADAFVRKFQNNSGGGGGGGRGGRRRGGR